MTSNSLSLRDRLELGLIRLMAIVLSLFDGLFRVNWGERLLDRMTERWETRISELDQTLAQLDQERTRLHLQTEAISIHAAVIYLGGRSLARNELIFDPADPQDEEVLDASINLLVKQKLAAIETEEIEASRFVYHLDPDWPAIRAFLTDAAEQADPEIADWLTQGTEFIDEALLFGMQPQKSDQGKESWNDSSSKEESL